MGKPLKFIAGVVLIAAGVAIGGPVVGGQLGSLIRFGGMALGSALASAALAPSLMLGRQRGIEINDASPAVWLPVVYGRARLGLRLVDLRTTGQQNKFLYLVGAVCVGSEDGLGIAAVEEIYFDGKLAIAADGTVQAPWAGKVQHAVFLGTDTQNVATGAGAARNTLGASLNATFPSDWPTTSAGRGLVVLVFRLEYDAAAFPGGRPEITVTIKGQRVPEVRNASQPRSWSANPALCLYDYLRSVRYGMGAAASEVDGGTSGSFAVMANYYDELVTVPSGSQARFESHGWLTTDPTLFPEQVRQLLTSCRGNLVWQQGQLRLLTRRAQSPVSYRLTEDELVGPLRFRLPGVASVPNSMRATYLQTFDFGQVPWSPDTIEYPRPGDPNSFLTEDGGVRVTMDLELPFTANPYTAEQIAAVELQERRDLLVVECTARESALQLVVGDVVQVTHATPGWTDKPFWVAAVALLPGQEHVQLLLQEYNANAYLLPSQGTFSSAPNTSLPDPSTCQAPSNLLLASDAGTAFTQPNGVRLPGIRATWTASPDGFLDHYEVQLKRTSATAWTDVATPTAQETEVLIGPVSANESWDVRVRAVNRLGVPSSYVQATITSANLVLGIAGQSFVDTFESSHVLWQLYSGAGTLSHVAGQGVSGTQILRMTGGGGSVGFRAVAPDWVAYDPSKLYRIRFRVRQFSDPTNGGGKNFYLGWQESDGSNVLQDGSFSAFAAAYAETLPAGATWVEYTGWLQGTAASRTYPATAPTAPMPALNGTRYIRPLILCHGGATVGNGQFDVDYVAVDVFDEVGQKRLYLALGAGGNLDPSVQQSTPSGSGQPIVRGRQRGTARHGDAVVFSPPFPQVPQSVRIWGGIVNEPRSVWSTDPNALPGSLAPLSGVPTVEETAALNLTASGFTVRALLRQDSGTLTQRTNSFPAGTLSQIGDQLPTTVTFAPSHNQQYDVSYGVHLEATAGNGETSTTITVAIDVSLDSGTTWTEKDVQSFSVSSTSGTQTFDQSVTRTITQAGLDSTDQFRVRIKDRQDFVPKNGSVVVSVDPGDVIYYTASSSARYASKTPDAGQVVNWEADYYA